MTYFEVIDKAYNYLLNEDLKDKLEELNFSKDNSIDLLKTELKKAKIFLNLFYQKKYNKISNKNEKLLCFLDLYFTEYITDVSATIEKTIIEELKNNLELIKSDSDCEEMLEMLNELDLPDEEREYYLNYIVNKFIYNLEKDEIEPQVVKKVFYTSLNNILDYTKETITELLFTEEGKKYIDNPYWIEDAETREKARLYMHRLTNDINESNTLRHIEDYNQWTKQIIDIVPLIYEISKIPNGIDNLIEMDNYLKENFPFVYKDAPLLVLLNDYKKESPLELNSKVENKVDDKIINLFFNNTDNLTPNDKSLLLIVYYYNGVKDNIYEDIIDNFDDIINILQSNDNKFEKDRKIRGISKVLK